MENEKNYPYAYGYLQGRIKAVINNIRLYGGNEATAKFLQNALDAATHRENLSTEAIYQELFLENWRNKNE